MNFLNRLGLLDYETVEDAPAPDAPAPEPEPEPTPEPQAEPEAWAGPSREEWEQTQAQLAQAAELVQILQGMDQTQQPQPQPEPVPEFDMFDPDGVRAHDEWLLNQIDQRMAAHTAPITDEYQNRQAAEWAEQTFNQLGVPEGEHWRYGVLFTSAGFQQFDEQGRAMVHPSQAARQGYDFLKQFAAAEREAAIAEYKSKQEAENAALRERAGSPDLPSGPAGGEGAVEYQSLEQATRAWLEQDAAANAAG